MQESVPQIGKEAAVFDQVMAMHHDIENGLRVFQDAINYSIYHMFVHSNENSSQEKTVDVVHYLQDLSERLRSLEDLLNENH